ncbi:septum site-determining protein MinC [Latilactobacillus curvatus]|uniref:Septum site-determining protein MinC n=2 Tax=Latilactobacillus curvatus TaxID=28038 RepID=A0AAJ5RDU6_LATCU|nr:septum site-determining protein MinC [Latilactobacillus curvatus]ASN62007.1 septation inhibitor protein [Latilactobacillus curvatus]AWV72872.1 septation inhibitor protein [Latilactobacillus curvatus]EHE85657.1 septum formation inhibitor MinC, C-terminal domain protein [Latilactobacillus curvatus CRL 705]KRK91323.1 septum formation inhibitor MinC, C-terminal domain protein [Latilactobacillus curvatus JCM 1096 = DSM 20019]MCM6843711.1 septation inhibitor protein [Latilactobacillus curvatus]
MDAVTLRGRKEGFELNIDAGADFDQALVALAELLNKIRLEQPQLGSDQIELELTTGRRLLNDAQKQALATVFEQFPEFNGTSIQSEVMTIEQAEIDRRENSIHVEPNVLRSGQEVNYVGDVLFVGNLHQGATLKATGSIFVLGEVAGIVHAGFPDNAEAVVAGDLSHALQLRIADAVEILDHKKTPFTAQSVSFINDLHVIDYGELTDLKQINPKLYRKMKEQ